MKKKTFGAFTALSLLGLGLSVIAGCKAATPVGTITLEASAQEFWANHEYSITAKFEGENFDLDKAAVAFEVPQEIVQFGVEGNTLSFVTGDSWAKDVTVKATLYIDADQTTALASAEVKFDIHKEEAEFKLANEKAAFKQGDHFDAGDLEATYTEYLDGQVKSTTTVPHEGLIFEMDGEEISDNFIFDEIGEYTVTVTYEAKNMEATYNVECEASYVYQLGKWFDNEYKQQSAYEFDVYYVEEQDEELVPELIAEASVLSGEGYFIDATAGLYYEEVELMDGSFAVQNTEVYWADGEEGENTFYDHGFVIDNMTEAMPMEEFKDKHADMLLDEFTAADFACFDEREGEEGVELYFEGSLSEDNLITALVEKFYGVDYLLEQLELDDLDFAATCAMDLEQGAAQIEVEMALPEDYGNAFIEAGLTLWLGDADAKAAFEAIDAAYEEETVEDDTANYALRYLTTSFAQGKGYAFTGATATNEGAAGIFSDFNLMHLIAQEPYGVYDMALTVDDDGMGLYPFLLSEIMQIGEKQYLNASGQIMDPGIYSFFRGNAYNAQVQKLNATSTENFKLNLFNIPGLSYSISGNDISYEADLWNYEGSSDIYQLDVQGSAMYAYDTTFTLYGSYIDDYGLYAPYDYIDTFSFYQDELGQSEFGDASYKTDMVVTFVYYRGSWSYYGWNAYLYGADSEDLDTNLGLADIWELGSSAYSDYALTYMLNGNGGLSSPDLYQYVAATEITNVADLSLAPQATFQLEPQAVGAQGATPTEPAAFTFATSDPEVATVDKDGLVTAVAAGTCEITITDTVHNLTKVITVTVKEQEPAGGNNGSVPPGWNGEVGIKAAKKAQSSKTAAVDFELLRF